MLLVTGGSSQPGLALASTEVLAPGSGSWRQAGPLPRPVIDMKVATLDNKVFCFGECGHSAIHCLY